jgi:hypothetical protein
MENTSDDVPEPAAVGVVLRLDFLNGAAANTSEGPSGEGMEEVREVVMAVAAVVEDETLVEALMSASTNIWLAEGRV